MVNFSAKHIGVVFADRYSEAGEDGKLLAWAGGMRWRPLFGSAGFESLLQ
jgi:hypothetical protein